MTLRQPASRLPEQPSEPKTLDFDYAALNPETRIVVQQRTSEIKTLIQRTAQDIFDIGQKLVEVKAKLGHGNFMSWLKSEFNWSVSTATRFMQVNEQFKFTNLANSNIAASALYELAAPSTPIDARTEAIERAVKGESITYSKAKEIVNRYQGLVQSEADQSVTIDIDALTVETDCSPPSKQHQSPLAREKLSPPEAPSKASRATHIAVSNNQTETTATAVTAKSNKHLLHFGLPNPSSMNADNRLSAISNPPDIELDSLCSALLLNVEHLSHDQIDALWQVLAHRIELEKLALSNWSSANLQRLNAAALEELKKRHTGAQL